MKQQYQIVKKKVLTPEISQISVHAPLVAAKAKAGQFIILRVDEKWRAHPADHLQCGPGERDHHRHLPEGGRHDPGPGSAERGRLPARLCGPLGEPTHVEDLGRVAVLGGGLGCAIALPVARALHEAGNQVDLIGGFKTKDIVILEEGDVPRLHRPSYLHR